MIPVPQGWGYTSSHMEGTPEVPLPEGPPPADMPRDRPVQLPGGAWAYQQSPERMQAAQQEAQAIVAQAQAQRESAALAQMLKNVPVAQAEKAIQTAIRFNGLRGYNRDFSALKAAGMTDEAAATKALLSNGHFMFYGQGNALAQNLKAMTPPARPRWVPPQGDAPGHFETRTGGVAFPPASMTEQPLSTEAAEIMDPTSGKRLGVTARTGPRTQRIILDEPDKNLTPDAQARIYAAQERGVLSELDSLDAISALNNPKSPRHDYYLGLKDQLKGIRQKRDALLSGAKPTASSIPGASASKPVQQLPDKPTKATLVKDTLYFTKRGVARWDGEKFIPVRE